MPIGVYNLLQQEGKQGSSEEHRAMVILSKHPLSLIIVTSFITRHLWLHLDHLLPRSLTRTSRSTCSPPSLPP
jgi:hypothetical protein